MELKFDVLKAALDSIGILWHGMLAKIRQQSAISLVCEQFAAISEASRVAKRKRYGKLAGMLI